MSENQNCLSPYNRNTSNSYILQLQNTIPNKIKTNFMISIEQPTSSKLRNQKSPYTQNPRIQLSKSFHSQTPTQDLSKPIPNELKQIKTQAHLKNNLSHQPTSYTQQNYQFDKLTTRIYVLENELNIVKSQLQFEESEHKKFKNLYFQRYDEENDKDSQISILKEKNNLLESKLKHFKKNYFQHQQIIPKYDDSFEKIIIHLKDQISQLSKQLEDYKAKNNSRSTIKQLQEDIKTFQSNEENYQSAIEQLQKQNQELKSMNISFESQKDYFQNEIKKLQDYFNELLQANEKLTQENQQLQQMQLKYQDATNIQDYRNNYPIPRQNQARLTKFKSRLSPSSRRPSRTILRKMSQKQWLRNSLLKTHNNCSKRNLLSRIKNSFFQNFGKLSIQQQRVLSQIKAQLINKKDFQFHKDADSDYEDENSFFKIHGLQMLSKVESADFFKNKENNIEGEIMKLAELQQKSNETVNQIEKKREELESIEQSDGNAGQLLIKELEQLDKHYEELQIEIQSLSKKINDEFAEQQQFQQMEVKRGSNMSFQYTIQDELF